MLLLNDAFRALARQPLVVLLAMALVLVVSAAIQIPMAFAMTSIDLAAPPAWFGVLNIVASIALAGGVAGAYTVVCALLGRAMDRPLWKCASSTEALRRFFVPWFILVLIGITVRSIQASIPSPDAQIALEFVALLWGLAVVPLGACVMHYGVLNWEELAETLSPISGQFRLVIPVLMLGILQSVLQDAILYALPGGPEAAVQRAIVIALSNPFIAIFDLLAFAMMWRICIHHRDSAVGGGANYGDD